MIIGIEVTISDFNQYLDLNIDPQHKMKSTDRMTSLEYIYNKRNSIISETIPYSKIMLITVKPDIDSVASMCLIKMLIEKNLKLNSDLILRLISLAQSDRHGRSLKKEDYFNFDNHNLYGLPTGLPYMISNYKISLKHKVNKVVEYLTTGTFSDLNKYNKLVNKNRKRSIDNTTVQIIIPEKLVFVESKHRGATSRGYLESPTVIALNPQFNFGKGKNKISGKKWTIAQYNLGFIDLSSLKNEIEKLENGWGGSDYIIGSPQTKPSTLSKNKIIELTQKYII